MRFGRLADRPEPGAPTGDGSVDLSAFPGTWVNANPDTIGIAKVDTAVRDGRLSVRILAMGPDGLLDWGAVEDATLYTFGPFSSAGAGFVVEYDFGFKRTRLHGNLIKGLLVLSMYNWFDDGSGRPSYFNREYFALTHGRY